MPSLDDIPTLPLANLSGDDMIAVIDGSDRRSPRQATLAQLGSSIVNPALAADPESAWEALATGADVQGGAIDAVNSQLNSITRVTRSERPLRIGSIGDSLTANSAPLALGAMALGPNMGRAGQIGLSVRSGSTTGTVTDHALPSTGRPDIWINGGGQTFQIGSSAEFTVGGGATGDIRGDRACVAYVAGPGKGTFDLQYQVNGTGAWTNVTGGAGINTANATTIGVFLEFNLPTSNSPFFRLRVNNVTVGIVELCPLTGIYNSIGGGAIGVNAGFGSGLDVGAHPPSTPAAVFNPIWTALALDCCFSLWADAGTEWDEGGGWTTFYARARGAYPATDWVQISRNPSYEENVATWATGQSYAVGQKVLLNPTGFAVVLYNATSAHTSGASTQPDVGGSWTTVWEIYAPSPTANEASAAVARTQAKKQREWAIREKQTFLNGMELFGGSWITANARGLMNDVVHPNAAGVLARRSALWAKLPLGEVFLGGGFQRGANPNRLGWDLRAADFDTQALQFRGPIESTGAAAAVRLVDQAAPLDGARVANIRNQTNRVEVLGLNSALVAYFDSGSGLIGFYAGGDNWALGAVAARWNLFAAGISARQRTETAATVTVVATDHTVFCNATSNAITVNLPQASVNNGRILAFVKTDASVNAVTIDPSSSETINGVATLALPLQWDRCQIQSNGTNWIRIA